MEQGRASYSRWAPYCYAAPPLVFLGVFYFYPLAEIFGLSFSPEGVVGESARDGSGLVALFKDGYYRRVLWFTTWQAALSTLLTLVLALPGAYIFANYKFRGKGLIQSLTAIPFVLPTMVTAAAFQALLGRRGLVNRAAMDWLGLDGPVIDLDQTVWFFLLAHVFYNYTVVLRIVGGFWARLPRDLTAAARLLGASGSQAFFKITLPLLRPALLAASLLVFIFCFTSFGVVLLLGGPRLATLEVAIYRQAVDLFNLPLAAALSLVQIVFIFALMAVYTRFERRSAVSLTPAAVKNTGRPIRSMKDRLVVGGGNAFLFLLLGAPLLALLASSLLTENGWSLSYHLGLLVNKTDSTLFVPPLNALVNSLLFAVAATVIALALGWLSAGFLALPGNKAASFMDPLFMLPLSTSAVTLGFGFVVALDEPPLNLRTAWILPAIAHALVAYPFVIRSLLPAWRNIPAGLREAAAVLGAGRLRIWRHVDWPILGRALAVGAVFSFAMSLGEFGATVFVARPDTPTLPLAIYRLLTRPGPINYGQAMAMSCWLMAATGAGFVVLEKIKLAPGDF